MTRQFQNETLVRKIAISFYCIIIEHIHMKTMIPESQQVITYPQLNRFELCGFAINWIKHVHTVCRKCGPIREINNRYMLNVIDESAFWGFGSHCTVTSDTSCVQSVCVLFSENLQRYESGVSTIQSHCQPLGVTGDISQWETTDLHQPIEWDARTKK